MKKKIKDLTFFDVSKICSKSKRCNKCPLHIKDVYITEKCIIAILDRALNCEWPEIIEQEVDI